MTDRINIEFRDLSYFVKESFSSGKKQILRELNGAFSGGEFTAILGASGSGKSTLLNVLSGYITNNVKGSIMINDRPRNMKQFHKISTYIMQEDLIQPYLRVEEALRIAAKLKLGNNLNLSQTIDEIVNLLNLNECLQTRTDQISGGERKRLSLALDLIDKPQVIFVDEPISGLDSVTVNLCLSTLKGLANQGRTVICTIHQPSVSMMEQFDQVYFLAEGLCVYNGCTSKFLPFLSSINLQCPVTYSYSEYIIETVETDPESVPLLSEAIQNGKVNCRDIISTTATSERKFQTINVDRSISFETSFWTQFTVLLFRMLTQQWRNKQGLCIQLFHHLMCGIMFGTSFMGIGDNGKRAISNFYFCWLIDMFFLYTYYMNYVLLFPFELEIIRREYLNRWYGLKAYYLALSLRNVPVMVILGLGFLLIVYLLNGQPLEADRFFKFAASAIMIGLISEGFGLMIGCTFSSFVGSIVGAGLTAPIALVIFCGMGNGKTVSTGMQYAMRGSYLYYGFTASLYALYDQRPPFYCPEDEVCRYRTYKKFFQDVGMLDRTYYLEMIGLLAFNFAFRTIAYFVLRCRLKSGLSNTRISNFISRFIKEK